jgi:hypothetical protein
MRDWNRSRIGSNRPGATRQDAQMEVRDMGMSTIPAVWCFAQHGFRLRLARSACLGRAVEWSRPEVQLAREGC